MKIFGLIAFGVCLLLTTNQSAWAGKFRVDDGGTKHIKAGHTVKIREFWNCKNTPLGGISGAAEHGTIAMVPGTANHCSNPDQPSLNVMYTPQPGFVGTDQVQIYFGRSLMITLIVE